MRLAVLVVRFFVGFLFIFSGFIKLNDPVGLSFKLEEYFSPEVLNLPFLMPVTLGLALLLIYLEIILGVMLLIRSQIRVTLISLLLLVVFFTFLTFYSAYFNKVTDCGCFGDAIPLSPWQSFAKDLILLMAISFLIWQRKYILPPSDLRFQLNVIGFFVIVCGLLTARVLNHLPIEDFRPFREGSNILEGMAVPPDAPKPVYEYDWIFEKNGEEYIITTNGDFPQGDDIGDFTGKQVKTRLVEKGYEPPIKNFTISKGDTDFTAFFMQKPKLLLVVSRDVDQLDEEQIEIIKSVTDKAFVGDFTIIGLAPEDPDKMKEFVRNNALNFEYYLMDETTVKTIVRSNPGFLLVNKGVIEKKVHFKDVDELPIPSPNQSPVIP